jgi:hypothetical protein
MRRLTNGDSSHFAANHGRLLDELITEVRQLLNTARYLIDANLLTAVEVPAFSGKRGLRRAEFVD